MLVQLKTKTWMKFTNRSETSLDVIAFLQIISKINWKFKLRYRYRSLQQPLVYVFKIRFARIQNMLSINVGQSRVEVFMPAVVS